MTVSEKIIQDFEKLYVGKTIKYIGFDINDIVIQSTITVLRITVCMADFSDQLIITFHGDSEKIMQHGHDEELPEILS